jgi:hypothetical protein
MLVRVLFVQRRLVQVVVPVIIIIVVVEPRLRRVKFS